MIYDAAARCWRAANPATVARWTAWRIAHPGWHAPLRVAAEAAIACGKPAALVALVASVAPGGLRGTANSHGELRDTTAMPSAQIATREATPETDYDPGYARGGCLVRVLSTPPGESRAVGAASCSRKAPETCRLLRL